MVLILFAVGTRNDHFSVSKYQEIALEIRS